MWGLQGENTIMAKSNLLCDMQICVVMFWENVNLQNKGTQGAVSHCFSTVTLMSTGAECLAQVSTVSGNEDRQL